MDKDNERIVVSCWHCQGRLRLPVGKVGRVSCPHRHCGKSFWVDTRRGLTRVRKLMAVWHNESTQWAGWLYLGLLAVWLPLVVVVPSRKIILCVFLGALLSALATRFFGKSDSSRAFQNVQKTGRIFLWALTGIAGVFSAVQLWLSFRTGDISAHSTISDLELYLDRNSAWILGWIDPLRVTLFGLALIFVGLVLAPAAPRFNRWIQGPGRYAKGIGWSYLVLTILVAFVLCASISDATIEGRTGHMETAIEATAWDYFTLRRDMARELAAEVLSAQPGEADPAALKRLVLDTIEKRSAPAAKKISEFTLPDYLRSTARPAPGADGRMTALNQSLQESLHEASPEDVLPAATPGAGTATNADPFKDFSIGSFCRRYDGLSESWQRTRASIAALEPQRDQWEQGFGTIDRNQIPDGASREGIAKWRKTLPQWFPPNPEPKEEMESTIEQTIDVDCNKVLLPSVTAELARPNLDFLSEQVKSYSDAFLEDQSQKFLADLGRRLFAETPPDKTNVLAAFDGYVRTPVIRALVTRLKALEARVQRDCKNAGESSQDLDAEINRKLTREFPAYTRDFESFARAQLSLPKGLDGVCESIITRLKARLAAEPDPESRFRLLRKWGDQIAMPLNREPVERYQFLAQFEQGELQTDALAKAARELGKAQERGGKWGAFRQQLELDLAAGKSVIPTGREKLRELLNKWDRRRDELAPEFCLVGGDWDVEFARQLTDFKQAAAWGEVVTLATNLFDGEVKIALEERAKWLQTNDPALGLASTDWGGRTQYQFGPQDFGRLPVLPEDGYHAYIASVHPAGGDRIMTLARLDLNAIEREEGYINPAYNDCILMLARDVNFQKEVVARYPIQCPPGLAH